MNNDSFGRNETFSIGMTLLFYRALYGVVGMGIVIDVSSKGHLLGVDTSEAFEEYIMMRVTKSLAFAKDLIVMIVQHGCLAFVDIVSKMVLWRVQDVDLPLEDLPMNIVGIDAKAELLEDPFVSLENWMDHIVFQRSTEGDLVAIDQINCSLPSEPFENNALGDGFVGIIVLKVFIGDVHERMIHHKWPILECGFSEDCFLSGTVDHFSQIPKVVNRNVYLGGQKKAPSRFINRDQRNAKMMSSYARKTNLESIREVPKSATQMSAFANSTI